MNHHATKHHHTGIIVSLFSIPFVFKCAAKKIVFIKMIIKVSTYRDFAYAREIIKRSLTLDSGKIVVFSQTNEPLVCLMYYLGSF